MPDVQKPSTDVPAAVSAEAARRAGYERTMVSSHGRSAEQASYGVDPGKDRWSS